MYKWLSYDGDNDGDRDDDDGDDDAVDDDNDVDDSVDDDGYLTNTLLDPWKRQKKKQHKQHLVQASGS